MAQITLEIPLILASGSTIRKRMLERAGIAFTAMPPACDEEKLQSVITHWSIDQQAEALAKEKAFSISGSHPESMVLGADQICELNGKRFSKPGTHEKAAEQLRALQGQTHQLHTAACLFQGEECLWKHSETVMLAMRDLSYDEVEAYVTLDQPLQSCGSYKFERLGRHLFSRVEGGYDAILGLPLLALLNFLYDKRLIRLDNRADIMADFAVKQG